MNSVLGRAFSPKEAMAPQFRPRSPLLEEVPLGPGNIWKQ